MNIKIILLVALAASAQHLAAQTLTLPVTNGLKLWLNADAINTADSSQVTSNGVYYNVKKCLDQSGNGYGISQPNVPQQPGLFTNNTNGHAILRFTGSESLNTALPQISGDKTIFIVEKRVDNAVRTEISSTAVSSGMFLANDGGAESAGRLNIAHDIEVPGQLNDWIVKSLVRSGTAETLTVNGLSSTVSTPDAASGNYTIGGPTPTFAGLIAEVAIYNRALSASECQSVENYLSEKYALWTYTLPVRTGLQFWATTDSIQGAAGVYDVDQVRYSGTNMYLINWYDRSNGGYAAQQTSNAFQPLYLSSGLSGRGVIQFNGVDNFLSTNLPQIAGDKSIFVVQQRTAGNNGLELSNNNGDTGMFLAASGTFETKGRLYVAQDLSLPSQMGQYIVKSLIRSGSNETLQVNDSAASGQFPDSAAGEYTVSSSVWPFQGNIAEILMYNRAVSGTEATTIDNYLYNKWSYPANNLFSVTPDLEVPPTTNGTPGPGLRVRQTTAAYAGTNVYHTLYLPTDWQPGQKYPVIVEYAPNGPFSDAYGDTDTGNVEDSSMGYGLSGGHGFIWVCLPTIGGSPLSNQTLWWGNMSSTEDYCLKTIYNVCQNYGGDPSAIILAGFSRGGIACNYVGLYDSTIADVWLAFIPHSGYDGQYTNWGYPVEDTASALARLQRLQGRSQHISFDTQETSPWSYLASTGVSMTPFTFRTLPYLNHIGTWPEDPIQLRRDTQAWLQQVVAQKPGTHSISGKVTTSTGVAIPGAQVQSGATHFTLTDTNGNYVLAGLINSARTLTATATGHTFATTQSVTVSGSNVTNINFQSSP